MEQHLEIMMGIVFLILGLSIFLRTEAWTDWFEGIRVGGPRFSLAIGLMHLYFGALIVALHPVWSGWSMILTIIGVWAIGEGAVYLLFPSCLAKFMGWLAPHRKFALRFSALAAFLIGAVLLYPYCPENCAL